MMHTTNDINDKTPERNTKLYIRKTPTDGTEKSLQDLKITPRRIHTLGKIMIQGDT